MKLLDTWNKKESLLKHILGCIEGTTVEEAQRLISDEVESVLRRGGFTPMEERYYLQTLYDASTYNYLRECAARIKAAEVGLDYKTMESLVLPKLHPNTDDIEDIESNNKIVSKMAIYLVHSIWHDGLVSKTLEAEADGLMYIETEIGGGVIIRKGRTMAC